MSLIIGFIFVGLFFLALAGFLWSGWIVFLIFTDFPDKESQPRLWRQKSILTLLLSMGCVCLGLALFELYQTISLNHPGIKLATMIVMGVGFMIQLVTFWLAEEEFDIADLYLSPLRALGPSQARALGKIRKALKSD